MIRKLKIAVLQLNPRIGQVSANIERANRILIAHGFSPTQNPSGQKKQLDILILPELAFTGYNFKSKENISAYLEPTTAGISTRWAQDISQSLNCHTLIGYPERCSLTNNIYNAATMISPSGKVLFNYRKSFLYDADVEWGCSESPDGFQSYGPFGTPEVSETIAGLKIQVGICMDLNPYKFQSDFNNFEFATSCKKNDISLILCPMAWLNTDSPNLESTDELKAQKKQKLEYELDPFESDLRTVKYWMLRMYPFIREKPHKKIAFIACNRSGWEDDILYAGSSTIATFDPSVSSSHNYINLRGSLGQLEEDLLYQEIVLDN